HESGLSGGLKGFGRILDCNGGGSDEEFGAMAAFALDLDPDTKRRDDAVDDRQAEASALARFLGREERIEQSRQMRVVDAAARITNAQPYMLGIALDPNGDGA